MSLSFVVVPACWSTQPAAMPFSFIAKHRKPWRNQNSIFFLFARELRTVRCSLSDCQVIFCNNIKKTRDLDVIRDEGAAIVTGISAWCGKKSSDKVFLSLICASGKGQIWVCKGCCWCFFFNQKGKRENVWLASHGRGVWSSHIKSRKAFTYRRGDARVHRCYWFRVLIENVWRAVIPSIHAISQIVLCRVERVVLKRQSDKTHQSRCSHLDSMTSAESVIESQAASEKFSPFRFVRLHRHRPASTWNQFQR